MNNDRLKFRVWWQSPYTNVSSKFLYYDPHKNNYETDIIRDADCDFAENIVYYDLRDIILGNIDEYTRPGTFTVEQCTGLRDKNGNLIYEGDVIQFTHNRGYFTNKGDIRVIEFSAFRFCGFGWRSRPENNVEFALTESAAKKCVVIGNIHEQAKQKDVK